MFKKILVVCEGNICRSPMTEYLIRNDPSALQAGIQVASAGLAALVDQPADSTAQELMMSRGIDLSAHRARQLTPKLLLAADLVLVMESRQQREIETLSPVSRGRVQTLGRWRGTDIPDPYRKPRDFYEKVLMLIENSVGDWRTKLW
ncbi:MAG: low molecular weight phosphotyrosine protein phosphatase [Desulfobacteraceae bacterium]|nr:low molecular weight phosphotyrosine protein phosphatase [Desulfobacteraceae bacterium]